LIKYIQQIQKNQTRITVGDCIKYGLSQGVVIFNGSEEQHVIKQFLDYSINIVVLVNGILPALISKFALNYPEPHFNIKENNNQNIHFLSTLANMAKLRLVPVNLSYTEFTAYQRFLSAPILGYTINAQIHLPDEWAIYFTPPSINTKIKLLIDNE
jgi:hypothetical protein